MNAFTYLPPECRAGTCTCPPGGHYYQRSPRCLSGECTHHTKNLHCGEWHPITPEDSTK